MPFHCIGFPRRRGFDVSHVFTSNRRFVESLFSDPVGSEGGGERLIVAAKNGGNILDYDTFLDVWRVVDDVRTLEFKGGDGGLESYPFVCRRADGDCIIDGVPRYFATRPLTQEDILHAVNRPQFADGMNLGVSLKP